ncbi:MAG: murein hydrolase activator EnvC family protein [Alphaproteobacteria bacterium]
MRLLLSILLIFFISSSSIFAQSKTAKKLATIKNKIKNEKNKQKKLDKEQQKIKTEIKKTQSKTISLAKELQEKESSLFTLKNQFNQLKSQEKTLSVEIEKERKSIISLLVILQKIALEPPSLVLMQKKTYGMNMMNTALLVEGTVEIAQGKIANFTKKKERLKNIKIATKRKSSEAEKVAHKVKSQKIEMDNLLSKKKKTEKTLKNKVTKANKKIKALVKESKNLSQLLKKLMAKKKKVSGKSPTAKNKVPAPARGRKVIRFGTKKSGIRAKGLTLKSAPKASVISPYNGRVLFSGPFKKFDNLMIIEHQKHFHSVIAGIKTPFVKEGKSILAGEPIGRLGQNGKIYIELRYKNKPVNPEKYYIIKN